MKNRPNNPKLKNKLRVYLDLLRRSKKEQIKRQAIHDYNRFIEIKNALEKYEGIIKGKRLLDVGCGQTYPFSLLFHTYGNIVTGIDLDVVSTKYDIKKYVEIWQRNGLERMVKTFMGRILVQRRYYFYLKEVCNFPQKFEGLDIRQMDVTNLSFDDDEFDIVISNAVFEHIQDVTEAVRELKRVMKKGAITYNLIHLFTSLSGGHNLKWSNPDEYVPNNIPPWDHLRKNLFPAHVYLNKLRMKDYIQIFENDFTILECKVGKKEGEKLLTSEIKNELSEYSKDELITRDLIIIAKK